VYRTHRDHANRPKQWTVYWHFCCSPLIQANWAPRFRCSKDSRLRYSSLKGRQREQLQVALARCGSEGLKKDLRIFPQHVYWIRAA